jgi:hypothetical protein
MSPNANPLPVQQTIAGALPTTAALACFLAFLSVSVRAEENPHWQNSPNDYSVRAAVQWDDDAAAGPGVSEFSLADTSPDNASVTLPPLPPPDNMATPVPDKAEIKALADALGAGLAAANEPPEAKAIRIFNWVRNSIHYKHYFGLRKGARLTLLEGSGNDFDQASLLRELLVAAGYSPDSVQLKLRSQILDYEHLMPWVGLAETPFPGRTFQDVTGVSRSTYFNGITGISEIVAKRAHFACLFFTQRGSQCQGGPARIRLNELPSKAAIVADRLFVKLDVGGTRYDLDPSYKS